MRARRLGLGSFVSRTKCDDFIPEIVSSTFTLLTLAAIRKRQKLYQHYAHTPYFHSQR